MKKYFLIPFALCLLTSALLAQGTWTQKADFAGVARQSAVGFSIGSKGYIGTGLSGGTFSLVFYKDFWEWDQNTNVWTQMADFGGNVRSGAVGFSIGTKGYIGTGGTYIIPTQTYFNDFWEWDQSTNIWTLQSNFGGGLRTGAAGFSIGSKGYIGIGQDGASKNDFWEWDQSSNVWTQRASFSGAARWGVVKFSIGTRGYVGTGATKPNGSGYKRDFWEWNQLTDTWTQKADFGGTFRQQSVGFSIGLKGFLGTGADSSGNYKNDFWEWDQVTNIWTQKSNFSGTARYASVGFSIGNKGYIGTGCDNNQTKDFWEYCDTCTGSGVNELQNQISISIFPNPFSTQTTFSFSDYVKDATLKIYSVSGQEVKRLQITGYKLQVERGDLPAGIYFYRLAPSPAGEGRGEGATGKLIIQ